MRQVLQRQAHAMSLEYLKTRRDAAAVNKANTSSIFPLNSNVQDLLRWRMWCWTRWAVFDLISLVCTAATNSFVYTEILIVYSTKNYYVHSVVLLS